MIESGLSLIVARSFTCICIYVNWLSVMSTAKPVPGNEAEAGHLGFT
jgi:hypothetical protein